MNSEMFEMIAVIAVMMWQEIIWGVAITGILFLAIAVYRKSPGRKKHVAEERAREKKEWYMSTPDRLRRTHWGL